MKLPAGKKPALQKHNIFLYVGRVSYPTFFTMTTENKPVYIISDEPEKDSELFGFGAYAKTIAELIANKENKTPLVIGIYGSWGSGTMLRNTPS